MDAVSRRMLGVIGGMGPAATVELLSRIVACTDAQRDEDHLHVIVESRPQIPNRNDFLLGRGPDPTAEIVAVARRLAASGADLLVMPCNTATAFVPAIRAEVAVELVDWVAVAADGIAARDLGPARPPVGLLATGGTIGSGLYQAALGRHEIDVVVPDPQELERLMEIVWAVKGGRHDAGAARAEIVALGERLRDRGASAVLLGVTELSVVHGGQADRWPAWIHDAMGHVVRALVPRAGAALREA